LRINHPESLGRGVRVNVILPGGIWVGGERGISCFSLETLQPVGTIQTPARAVALLSYQGRVLAALANGAVKAFDGCGKEEFSHGPIGAHTTNKAVALLRNPHTQQDVLLCGQESGHCTAYDLPDFKPRGTFHTGSQGDITAIVDTGSDGIFATCGLSGDFVIWRWEREQEMNRNVGGA